MRRGRQWSKGNGNEWARVAQTLPDDGKQYRLVCSCTLSYHGERQEVCAAHRALLRADPPVVDDGRPLCRAPRLARTLTELEGSE